MERVWHARVAIDMMIFSQGCFSFLAYICPTGQIYQIQNASVKHEGYFQEWTIMDDYRHK